MRYLCFNCSFPPFHNKKVRQAIALTIDREKIAKQFSDEAIPTSSFYSPIHEINCCEISQKRNIKAARKLIMEALTEDVSVRDTLFHQNLVCLETFEDLASYICDHIEKLINLKWNVSKLSSSTQSIFEEKSCSMRLYGWTDNIKDPGYFLEMFYSADNFSNLTSWTIPSLQLLIEESKIATTNEARKRIFTTAHNLLLKELPMIPLFYKKIQSISHPEIKGIYSNSLNQFDIRFAFKLSK